MKPKHGTKPKPDRKWGGEDASGKRMAIAMSVERRFSMRGQSVYPPVTDELLATVVRRILAVGVPFKIVLFGSRARGDPRPDSDLDLLVVEESAIPRYQRAPRYLRALTGIFPGIDVVVWTPQEIAEWAGVTNHFITTILHEGQVFYAHPSDHDRVLTVC